LDIPKGARRLRSTTTVQVMYVQRASCNVKDVGDVSITTLIPTQHFHTIYIWTTDVSSSHPVHHYLVILSPQAAIKYLKLNLIEIGDKGYSWDWVIGTRQWKMVEISLTSKVGSLSAGGFNLGCYLYGLGVNVSYMYAPGFEKGAMLCTETETAAGDEVDNDCDGETDEESNNSFDDDMDGKIDEDLENVGEISGGWGQWMWWSCTNTCASHQARTRKCDHPKPAANQRGCLGKIEDRKPGNCSLCGGWGQWSEWKCTDICQATYMERNRTCDNPKPSDPKFTCEGDKVSQKPSNCNVCAADAGEWGDWTSWKCQSDICTYTYTQYRVRTCNKLTHAFENTKCYGSDFQDRRVCPPYRWGVECINNCYKCVDQCDSEGRCTNCILGHKFPNLSCNKECELFEFGANCEGNCLNKCAEDCLERYDGTCPFNKIHLLWIFLFIIPVGGLAYILYERKAPEPLVIENIESVIAFTNDKETDITTHKSTTTTGATDTARKNISIGDMISL
ncbi:coadhesin, partial [Biomphalaria pfeifferi]